MPDNIDKKVENLDNKVIELEKELYRLKCFLDIYKIIILNAKEINAVGWGKIFFWQVRQMSLDSYALGICKVFEEEKNHELYSLPSILETAKDCNPQDKCPLRDFINKYRDLLSQTEEEGKNSLIADIEGIYTKFYQKYFVEDTKIKDVRNKIIAHPEYIEDVMRPKNLPSYDTMEKILFFAIYMHSAISNAYLVVGPHPIKNDERVLSSTRAVLENFGVSNVKIKFDDE
jgi:hypothetical protein